MGRERAVLVALMVTLAWGTIAHAGNNAGGTVGLSWNAAGDSTDGLAIGGTTIPLFLHLGGVVDVHELAVNLRWVPYDSTGQCYSVLPPQPDSGCGWISNDAPGGAFGSDFSYTGSIRFPSGIDKNCVLYWVSTATCDSTPSAKFVATAYVMDSGGAIDTLRTVANARLLGTGSPDTSYFNSQAHRTPPGMELGAPMSATPNPASTSVTIRFSLPGVTAFRLGIYDIAGRLVRRAAVVLSARGPAQWEWDLLSSDGERVQAGIYFAHLATATGLRVIPVTVLK